MTIVSTFFLYANAACGDSSDPWNFTEKYGKDKQPGVQGNSSPAARFFIEGVNVFREYVSPVDGDRCMMHPSCTTYSIEAVRKHGIIIGYIMTIDRLIHENNEMDFARVTGEGEGARFQDSVENNDFWWYRERR